jgi:hypothetical protein
VYKVETIGDCYMVAGGLIKTDDDGFKTVTTQLDPDHARKVYCMHTVYGRDTIEESANGQQL